MPQACSKWVAIIIATITTAMAIEAAVAQIDLPIITNIIDKREDYSSSTRLAYFFADQYTFTTVEV